MTSRTDPPSSPGANGFRLDLRSLPETGSSVLLYSPPVPTTHPLSAGALVASQSDSLPLPTQSSQTQSFSRLLSPASPSSPHSRSNSGGGILLPSSLASPPLSAISVSTASGSLHSTPRSLLTPPAAMFIRGSGRSRSSSRDTDSLGSPPTSPPFRSRKFVGLSAPLLSGMSNLSRGRKYSDAESAAAKAAQLKNDSMVYLEGPCVYACAQCRTHLTSHDDIISKSFHGRHGRAYLFDQCVNVTIGPPEDRLLITGLHSVNDIFCKRCQSMVGWTYSKAYESSQKYKEGKFIVEKINLYLEESHYDVGPPAGERGDRWRKRSMSWGSNRSILSSSPKSQTVHSESVIYEYKPGATTACPYEYSPPTPRSNFIIERTVSEALPPSGRIATKQDTIRPLPSPPNFDL